MLKKCLKNPAKAWRYLANRVLAVFGHEDFIKFIVLGRSRTGSNLLLSFLNSHSGVFAKGEIFQKLRGRDRKKILASVFNRQPRHIKAAGFKIFYYHPLDGENDLLWRELLDVPGLHVIHLKRRNILNTLVSRKIADAHNAWQITSGLKMAEKPQAVLMDREELKRGFMKTREWEANAERMFVGHKLHTIYYEDLDADPLGTFKRVIDFLGLVYQPPRSKLKKQNTQGLKERIINYDELKDAFSGSNWAPFFEE